MEYDNSHEMPIGIQDFEKLRRGGYPYVDKTEFLYRLVRTEKPYFLSRPRRFGKSLFLSMVRTYFEGKRELFEGLAIAQYANDWKEYPVLYFDFAIEKFSDKASLVNMLETTLRDYEARWGGDSQQKSISLRFSALIKSAYDKAKMPVVALFDEYDKSMLDAIDKPAVMEEMRDVLSGFYGTLKSADRYLRFVMWTGVSKFAKTSIFSGFNQPEDISMTREYAAICGISESEMKANFMPDIRTLASDIGMTEDAALAELKKQYDGYHFCERTEEGIYNPFSLLYTLKHRKFSNYWFKTGTPTFLIKMVKDARIDVLALDCGEEVIAASDIEDYRADSNNPVPLMYQSGYLTITGYDPVSGEYELGFPNEEVRRGFVDGLLELYLTAKGNNQTEFAATAFSKDLRNDDMMSFKNRLTAFFASISYDLNNRTHRDFQTILSILLISTGYMVRPEKRSSYGRSDIVLELPKAVYIFELKMSSDGTAADALAQIDEKGYAAPYMASGKRIVKIGIEIDGETRTVKDWKDNSLNV